MEKLGVELPLLITQIINFVIMVFILTKLLYKPILKALDERKRKISESLKLADSLKDEEFALNKRKLEVVANAQATGREIIEQAKKDAALLKEEMMVQGKVNVLELKLKMEKELKSNYEDLEKQLSLNTVTIAVEMVKKLIPEIMSEEKQHQLVIKQLKLLEKKHE